MRTIATLCLALLLAVTIAPVRPAEAGGPPPADAGMAAHCADMDMEARPAGAPEPAQEPTEPGCVMICPLGCVTPAALVGPRIGQPVAWRRAFGRPPASLEPGSATPEAEDPPPRTLPR